MRRPPTLTLLLALLLLQLPPEPAEAWYKHAATPRFHTVGRAAGLLLGLRRAPPVWRHAGAVELGGPRQGPLAGESVVAGRAARYARSLPSGVQALRWGSGQGLPVWAVRRPRVPEPRVSATSGTGAEQARASTEPAELPWSAPGAAVAPS